jgi:hypothetical protein
LLSADQATDANTAPSADRAGARRAGDDYRSKTRVLDKMPKTVDELPLWNYDGSSTGQAPGEDSEVFLQPAFMCKDPMRPQGNNILVLCEMLTPDMKPIPTSTRSFANEIFKGHEDEVPWCRPFDVARRPPPAAPTCASAFVRASEKHARVLRGGPGLPPAAAALRDEALREDEAGHSRARRLLTARRAGSALSRSTPSSRMAFPSAGPSLAPASSTRRRRSTPLATRAPRRAPRPPRRAPPQAAGARRPGAGESLWEERRRATVPRR